jgi:hypothetical protein
MTIPVEVWLRGPVPGVAAPLQPAAHTIIQVREDVERAAAGLTEAQLWLRPANVASIGFHLLHLPGALDRLLAYSRGLPLTDAQLRALAAERTVDIDRPALATLLDGLYSGIDAAVAYLGEAPLDSLYQPREVGRKRLPSTTMGLIFHAAEHSSRHAGQIVTLAPIVRAA